MNNLSGGVTPALTDHPGAACWAGMTLGVGHHRNQQKLINSQPKEETENFSPANPRIITQRETISGNSEECSTYKTPMRS